MAVAVAVAVCVAPFLGVAVGVALWRVLRVSSCERHVVTATSHWPRLNSAGSVGAPTVLRELRIAHLMQMFDLL